MAAFAVAVGTISRGADASGNAVAVAAKAKLDLNTADVSALEAIPEIGPRFAAAVVAARPFKTADDLQRIVKLSPPHWAALEAKVTALPPQEPPAAPRTRSPASVAAGASGSTTALASEQERAEARRRHIRRDGLSMTEPPPPLREEKKPEPPGPNYVWKPGHWSPVKGEWTWIPGEYAVPPTSISVWIDGTYDPKAQRWSPGYWEPDTVRVAEPSEGEKR